MSEENLREIPLSPDPVTFSPYCTNRVSWSRYTWINLFPKSIYHSLLNPAIFFYLCLSIIELYPTSDSSFEIASIIPLCVLIIFNLFEDITYKLWSNSQDKKLNSENFDVWDGKIFTKVRSDHILVGQIIKVFENEVAPADILVLSSSDSEGNFYVDLNEGKKGLDENLKNSVHVTQELFNPDDIENFIEKLLGRIKFIEPNNDFKIMNGTLSLDKHPRSLEVSEKNMIFRSNQLYGIKFIIGIVLYAGYECKIFYNVQKQPRKTASIEEKLSLLMVFLIFLYTFFVVFCTLVSNSSEYMPNESVFEMIQCSLQEFSLLIPIELYIYLDLIRLFQNYSIHYKMNKFCSFKTIQTNETLGQIEYIVSNSSGVLTEAVLSLKLCIIGFLVYQKDEDIDNRPQTQPDDILENHSLKSHSELDFQDLKKTISEDISQETFEYFVSITLCNSVIINENNNLVGASKEEICLVKACQDLGIFIVNKKKDLVRVNFCGKIFDFRVVAFKYGKNSRVIIEKNCAKWVMYVKGSDEKMFYNLDLEDSCKEELLLKIKKFKSKGLRLSILASREFVGEDLEIISGKINNAKSFPTKTEQRIENIFKKLESKLCYIGICGIEDVVIPDTELAISQLKDSGIKLWVASSEKKSAVVSTSLKSGLITSDQKIVYLTNIKSYVNCLKKLGKVISKHVFFEDPQETSQVLTIFEYKTSKIALSDINSEPISPNLSLNTYSKMHEEEQFNHQISFIEDSINKILDNVYNHKNLKYVVFMDSVSWRTAISHPSTLKLLTCLLFCADSACFYKLVSQDKANIVKLLKNNLKFRPKVLSIGSGEGDISMIQSADVGVIVKQESYKQFLYYSDILLEHFSLLRDLVLFHGLWNISRVSRVILLFLYKNVMMVTVFFLYSFISDYSSGFFIDVILVICYNFLLTSLSLIGVGVQDERFERNQILSNTFLYNLGAQGQELDWPRIFFTFFLGVFNGTGIFHFTYLVFLNGIVNKNGYAEDFELFGTAIFITLTVTALVEIMRMNFYFTNLFIGLNALSVGLFIIILIGRANIKFSPISGVDLEILNSPKLITYFFTAPLIFFCTNVMLSEIFYYFYRTKDLNRTKKYRKNLAGVFRHSVMNTKITKEIYDMKPFSMKFFSPYIEKLYQENSKSSYLKILRIIISILWFLFNIWSVLVLIFENYSNSYLIFRVLTIIVSTVFMILTYTPLFRTHFQKFVLSLISSIIFSKFVIEFVFENISLLTTGIIPSIIFIFFNVNWLKVMILNITSVCLYIVSITFYNSSQNTYLLIQSISYIIAICVTSALIARTLESTKRQEFKLLRLQEITYEKTQRILGFLLPSFVKKRVKDGVRYIAEDQGTVTVIFCDIVDFDVICAEYSPNELTNFLDMFFQKLDILCKTNGVSKIETVGKTYMACAGLKDSESEMDSSIRIISHAKRGLNFSLAIIEETCKFSMKNSRKLEVKIGIHSGPVTAGVVGFHKPQFSLVGDTVNTASRMCSTLEQGNAIQVSTETYAMVPDIYNLKFNANKIFAKGKGYLKTYTFSANHSSDYWNFLEDITSFRTCTALNSGIQSEKTEPRSSTKDKGLLVFLDESFRSDTAFLQESQWYSCSCKENNKEFRFRIDKLDNNKNFSKYGLGIAILAFGVYFVSLLIDMASNHNIFYDVVFVRVFSIFFLFGTFVFYQRIFRSRAFPFFTFFILALMFLGNLCECFHKFYISDLSTLEIMYLILLITHSTQLSFKGILWLTPLIYIPWLCSLIYLNNSISSISSSLFVLSFSIINSSAVYFRENQLRKYFNLKSLTEKDMKKTENLLVQMLPPHVLEYMKNSKSITDKLFDVTLLYADIVGFTQWSSDKTPKQVVMMLSELFTRFDKLCVIHKVYKVHTIGDCYVAMGYLDTKNRDPNCECASVINLALSMVSVINKINNEQDSQLQMRIGIHTGCVIAGIIGTNIVRYDIYGPDVLIANKMESCGEAGMINVSDVTKNIIENYMPAAYTFEFNKEIVLKTINRAHSSYYLKCSGKD